MITEGKKINLILALLVSISLFSFSFSWALDKEEKRKLKQTQIDEQFKWWPTDAKPAPVKDERGGYWWWPNAPGEAGPLWGNRGYCYVRKMIFDYKSEELPAPKPQELRPSLLIKKIIKNVKIYFDYDKARLRDDAKAILEDTVRQMNKNPESSILITGNCDIRGTEKYNEKLGRKRADSVKKYMLEQGISESKVCIVSRGKLDAIAHVTDLIGMQKDRNAQFMVAEVEEVMIPYGGEVPQEAQTKQVEEGKYLQEKEENVESPVNVSTKEYIIQKGDTLSKIAQKEYGKAYRWKNIYELNKDKIKNPNKLKTGKKIIIPIE